MPGSPSSRKSRPRPAKASSRRRRAHRTRARGRRMRRPASWRALPRAPSGRVPGPVRGSPGAAREAGAPARCRAPPPAPLARSDTTRAPQPGGPSGTARASAGRAGARAADARRSGPPALPPPRRGGLAPSRPRSCARAPPDAPPRGGRFPAGRTARKPGRRVVDRATAQAHLAAAPPPSRGPPCASPRRVAQSDADRARLRRASTRSPADASRAHAPPRLAAVPARATCAAAKPPPKAPSHRPPCPPPPTARRPACRSRRPRWRAGAAWPAGPAVSGRQATACGHRRMPRAARGSGISSAESASNVTPARATGNRRRACWPAVDRL
jgi:hypothetical protein